MSLFFAGNYFASHFIMGGEKFDSTHPEGYLFGENTDLNFLGTRPVAVRSLRSWSFPSHLFLLMKTIHVLTVKI